MNKGRHFHTLEKAMATNPLQCSCLENPRDGGAWWAAIYGVAESDMSEVTAAAAADTSLLISTLGRLKMAKSSCLLQIILECQPFICNVIAEIASVQAM